MCFNANYYKSIVIEINFYKKNNNNWLLFYRKSRWYNGLHWVKTMTLLTHCEMGIKISFSALWHFCVCLALNNTKQRHPWWQWCQVCWESFVYMEKQSPSCLCIHSESESSGTHVSSCELIICWRNSAAVVILNQGPN